MDNLSREQKLKNFQLALAMVGISTNIMTCELIHSIAAMVDEKGKDFNVGDAQKLSEAIQAKYSAAMQQPPPPPSPMQMMEQIMRDSKKEPNPDTTKEYVEPEELETKIQAEKEVSGPEGVKTHP